MIELPTKEEMLQFQNLATDGGKISLREWAQAYLVGLSSALRKSPELYRNFGPWWWIVKHAMLEAGQTPLGTHIDAEMLEAMEHEDGRWFSVLCAAAYQENSLETQWVGQSTHVIVTDGEDSEYVIYDHGAEAYIKAHG